MTMTERADDVLAARRRHPSSQRWRPDVTRMAQLVAAHLAHEGMARAGVAASVLAVRGAAGLDRIDLARELAIDDDVLARAEAGDVAADDLPPALIRLVQGLV
jgi:hypothetical protein